MPAFRLSPIFKYTIKGDSMRPTYKPNEEVYVNRLAYLFRKPKIGDVVIIKGISRQIRQAHDKQVPRQRAGRRDKLIIKRIDHLSKQGYFLLGDNKSKSTDSRHFGVIKKQDIVGKILTNIDLTKIGI